MKWDKDSFTFGAELEIADIDTTINLGNLGKWDYDDYTIANSSGIGNDPKKKLVRWGGEINTTPTQGVDKQVEIIEKILNLFPKKNVNFTCNLHFHVGVSGLKTDLNAIKKLTEYFYNYQDQIYSITENLEKPNKNDYVDFAAYEGAMKRYKRRLKSHQQRYTKNLYMKLMSAESLNEYFEFFAPKDKSGKPMYHLVTRPGCNILQLNFVGTIEYRHFSMTFDIDLIRNSLIWVREITYAGLVSGESPYQIWKRLGKLQFPSFQPYNYDIDRIFRMTHFGKLNRSQVKQNLIKLLEEGRITKEDIGFDDFMERR